MTEFPAKNLCASQLLGLALITMKSGKHLRAGSAEDAVPALMRYLETIDERNKLEAIDERNEAVVSLKKECFVCVLDAFERSSTPCTYKDFGEQISDTASEIEKYVQQISNISILREMRLKAVNIVSRMINRAVERHDLNPQSTPIDIKPENVMSFIRDTFDFIVQQHMRPMNIAREDILRATIETLYYTLPPVDLGASARKEYFINCAELVERKLNRDLTPIVQIVEGSVDPSKTRAEMAHTLWSSPHNNNVPRHKP